VTKQSQKQPALYIMTNSTNTVLYTGVTSNLVQRIYQHKDKTIKGFTSKYNCTKLVYFELFDDMTNAIIREKQIKGGSRQKKRELIESINPQWSDLYESLL
jgi:putative endonuclease